MNEAWMAKDVTSGLNRIGQEIVGTGRNLWLAGLGAAAQLGDRSRAAFERLVERGRPLEERQRKAFEEVGSRAGETAREMRKLLEDTAEYELKRLVKRMGVMTREDLNVLSARVEVLSRKIDEYAAAQPAPRGKTRKTSAPSPEGKAVRD